MKIETYLSGKRFISSLLISSFFICKVAFASTHSYDEPIKFNSRYVTAPEKVIIDSLIGRGWEIKSQRPGSVTGWLNNYKDYDIVLEVNYAESQISFKHISAKKLNCSNCNALDKHYDKWRLYLRKSIALNIHTLAINELLAISSIKKDWLSVLEKGSVQEKTKFARNIIDIELFDNEALDIIEKEVIKGYKKENMTGHEVQLYAFYCKALARTTNSKYAGLLTEVKNNAGNRKLKKYVTGYLAQNYSSDEAE